MSMYHNKYQLYVSIDDKYKCTDGCWMTSWVRAGILYILYDYEINISKPNQIKPKFMINVVDICSKYWLLKLHLKKFFSCALFMAWEENNGLFYV